MGIYRDNLSAIVIGDNFLSIIVIAQNSLDLSITVIAFVIYFVIADKLSRLRFFMLSKKSFIASPEQPSALTNCFISPSLICNGGIIMVVV